ncbi:hypothetical protein DVH24_009685 [Malus domestica]|uniref:Uncharacterized protein n=1 Tax=Malus domestica TaxID=3750 RepID=A0A498JSG7_MALDO|nr:hypothetical protein DVH24_009685 [Malus domestica]
MAKRHRILKIHDIMVICDEFHCHKARHLRYRRDGTGRDGTERKQRSPRMETKRKKKETEML